MIKEENFGYRDKRGHFVPKEAADKNPIWILPFNLKRILAELNWYYQNIALSKKYSKK